MYGDNEELIKEKKVIFDQVRVWFDPNEPDDLLLRTMWINSTSGSYLSDPNRQVATPTATKSAAHLRVDRLSKIQSAFGFPVRNLAEILGISRAQLYKWIDPSKEITLHNESAKRLALIERIGQKWQLHSRAPLHIIAREPLKNGGNILSLLSESEINEAGIMQAFSDCSKKLSMKQKTISQRMSEVGFNRRSTHRLLPSDE